MTAPPPNQIATNEYGTYCVPRESAHRGCSQCIINGKVWEPKTLKMMTKNGTGEVVDAGSYFGDFLPALSVAFDKVWAFEPNPVSFWCATRTIQMNGLKNVIMAEACLLARPGQAELKLDDAEGLRLGGGTHVGGEDVHVEAVTLDDVLPADSDITVIHLDVEGSERSALIGAAMTIERCSPMLVLETTPPKEIEDRAEAILAVVSMLSELGALGYHSFHEAERNTFLKRSNT